MAFKVKRPPALRKPAAKPAAKPAIPTPQETRAPEVAGIFNDPIKKTAGLELPAPTFEADSDPLTSAINGELGRLNQQDIDANRNQFGTNLARLQEDTATKLANLQQQRDWATQDVRRQQDELRRRAPLEQRDIAAQQAGRGGYFSSAREEQQGEAARQTDEAIQSGERALQRGETEFRSATEDAKRDADRARQDLEANKADFERRVKEGEFKTAAAAAKAQTDSQRSEAGSWTNARYNELVASGASPEQARSRAIADARSAYPKVGDTWIAGSLAQKGTPKPDKYKGQISVARGKTFSPKKRAAIMNTKLYKQAKEAVPQLLPSYVPGVTRAAEVLDAMYAANPKMIDKHPEILSLLLLELDTR